MTLKHAAGALAASLALASGAGAETQLERGEYIVRVIGSCGNCHTPMTETGEFDISRELAGRLVEDIEPFTAVAPNITPAGRIAGWTDEEVARSIREGFRPGDAIIGPFMPIWLYRDMSDSDVMAVVAFLRTLPPVENEVPRSEWRIPLPESYGPPVGSVPDPVRGVTAEYGKYLAGPIAHCIDCHTPMGPDGMQDYENRTGAGGFEFHGPWGVSVSANLTSHPEDGIAKWTDDELVQMITTGVRPDGSKMLPPMGYSFYKDMKEEDARAIIAYLRTLPPVADAE